MCVSMGRFSLWCLHAYAMTSSLRCIMLGTALLLRHTSLSRLLRRATVHWGLRVLLPHFCCFSAFLLGFYCKLLLLKLTVNDTDVGFLVYISTFGFNRDVFPTLGPLSEGWIASACNNSLAKASRCWYSPMASACI